MCLRHTIYFVWPYSDYGALGSTLQWIWCAWEHITVTMVRLGAHYSDYGALGSTLQWLRCAWDYLLDHLFTMENVKKRKWSREASVMARWFSSDWYHHTNFNQNIIRFKLSDFWSFFGHFTSITSHFDRTWKMPACLLLLWSPMSWLINNRKCGEPSAYLEV